MDEMITDTLQQEFFLQFFALGIFLILAAFFAAYTELNAEGKVSFAWDLKTWFKVRGKFAKAFKMVFWAPLTGYHLGINFLFVSFFSALFFAAGNVSLKVFLYFALTWIIWILVWDFTWYLIHPDSGWKKFNKKNPVIYMYADRKWFLGLPIHYLYSILFTSLGMFVVSAVYNDFYLLWTHLARLLCFALYLFLMAVFGPYIGRNYKRLLENDERDLAKQKPTVKNYDLD